MAGCRFVKVALLSDCYLPRLGGIEVQVHDLAAHLTAAGHDVEVFTATAGAHGLRGGRVELVDGVPVHRFALPLPGGIPVNPLAPGPIRDRLSLGGFDVAHVHMGVVSPFATDLASVAIEMGLPTAITWHCVLDRSRPVWRLLGYARRWGAAGAALSAVSAMAARQVEEVSAAPVAVLGNGIDVPTWAPREPRRARAANAPIRITSALRFATRKRPGAIVSVLARARDQVPADIALSAEVFGDGPQRRLVEAELRRRGMDWVHLRGRVSRDVLRAAHHASDLYLSTARLEAFGIAALEARTAGLPVVGRRGTGIEDFVTDGVEGLLAVDDAGLAAAVARLSVDEHLRLGIAHHNATTPPPQAWPAIVESTLGEYCRAGAPAS